MKKLLLINPNTSASVTDTLGQAVNRYLAQYAQQSVKIHTVTAQFGAPYIADEVSYAIAQHAVLDAWSVAKGNELVAPDAVLIGCFGDPGLFAMREAVTTIPVGALAEAAFLAAVKYGRFAVVTSGQPWKAMLDRQCYALGLHDYLAGIHIVPQSSMQLRANWDEACTILTQACAQAAKAFSADVVILGGAGLTGFADDISSRLTVPLLDSVHAGAQWIAAQFDSF